MEFRLLGPLEVAENGHAVTLGGSRARALLALLLLHRNEVVTIDRIVDDLWGERPPKTAEHVVRVYVSRLRKALEPNRSDGTPQVLVTQGSGYVLRVGAGDLDVDRFDDFRTEGRRLLSAGEPVHAAEAFDAALALWRGPPLQDNAYEAFAQPEIARLEELHLATLEDRFDALLAAGRDSELVPDLEQLVQANPLREGLRARLMLALYRSGRQADALETYQRGRRLLVDELGLEPSKTLRRLEAQILQHDPRLERPDTPPHPAETSAPARRPRRLAVLGIAAVLLVSAAIAISIAATAGHRGRPLPASSVHVALVLPTPRSVVDRLPTPLDADAGLREAAKELGVHTRFLYAGRSESRFTHTIARAARNSDLVVVGATPYLRALSDLTPSYPGTRFLILDSVFDRSALFDGQHNVTGITFDYREGGYLGGYLAGLVTRGRQAVSAVGGTPTAETNQLAAGFLQGVRRARPGITPLLTYGETPGGCRTAANRQIDRGSAVVFDVGSGCGAAPLQVAGIRSGVWGLGMGRDESTLGPQILASVVTRLDGATQHAITLFADGKLPGGRDLRLDLGSNSIALVGISSRVSRTAKAKLNALTATMQVADQARE